MSTSTATRGRPRITPRRQARARPAEFGDGGQHMEDQAAGGRARVDRVPDGDEVDAGAFERIHDLDHGPGCRRFRRQRDPWGPVMTREVDLPKETWPGHVAALSEYGAKMIADELDRVASERAFRLEETYLRDLLRERLGA